MNAPVFPPLTIAGRPVPPLLLGRLAETRPKIPLREQLAERGYLLLRGMHDAGEVEAARHEVLGRLAQVDEARDTSGRGIATGRSRRAALHPDLAAFWRSVSEGPALRRVINGPRISAAMAGIFGEAAAHFSFAWLRAMVAGKGSGLHCDSPFMNRGSKRLLTVWTPLGSVALNEAPLYVVEGSHRWADLRERFEGLDVDRDSGSADFGVHAVDLASERGTRLLTSPFEAGDCLMFGMFTAHASFDNASPEGRIRLSCDTRFQPAADPMDDRWSGPNPSGHGGRGYGDMAGPLPVR